MLCFTPGFNFNELKASGKSPNNLGIKEKFFPVFLKHIFINFAIFFKEQRCTANN